MFGSVAVCALVAALSQTGATNLHIGSAAAPFASSNAIATAANPGPQRSAALVGLYASFVGLEALDIQSTLHAMGNGGVEANPAMRGVVSNSASFVAVKAATGGMVIWMAERMRKQHPRVAIVMMAGLNSALAIVVAHNYSIGR